MEAVPDVSPGTGSEQGVAVVTGGSGNLGSQIATGLALDGWRIVLLGRTAERLAVTAGAITTATGREVRYCAGDLGHRAALPALADSVWSAFGRVDVVVNSAVPEGSQTPSGDLLSTPDETWWQFFDPIVLGALGLARGLVPRMAEQGGGAFVNLGSPTGVVPSPGMDAYGMAKGGLLLLTRYMAREWGRWNIRANAVLPGLILDGRHITEESIATLPGLGALLPRTSLGRPGRADELVAVVAFLASGAASFVSGAVIPVDGGRF